MSKMLTRMLAAAAAFLMMAGLAGCGQGGQVNPTAAGPSTGAPTEPATAEPTPTPTPEPTPTPRVIITIKSIFPGEEPEGLPTVFEELNRRLDEDLLTRLELSWAKAGDYDDSVTAAVASGSIDFVWCSTPRLADFAAKNLIAPIDEEMAQYGQAIADNIDPRLFGTMKIGGKLMGIPSSGNTPLVDADHVLMVRDDLRLKYGLPELDSVKNIEAYLNKIKLKEPGVVPLCADNAAAAIMKAFGPEDFLPGTGSTVAYRINADGTVSCMGLQDAASYKGAVEKIREWYKAGLIPRDMLAVKDAKDRFAAGSAAATGGKALSAVSVQAGMYGKEMEAVLMDVRISNAARYYSGNGGNALCLAAGSNSGDKVVQFWAWVLSSQENYDLYNYGIEGEHYEIADGRIVTLDKSYSSFPVSMFRNMNYHRYPQGVSEEYAEAMKNWNEGAELSPLIGFSFSASAVKNELAKAKAVYEAYGPLLNTGSSDPAALLAEYAARMKNAGIDKILAEAQAQVDAWLARNNP